MSTPTPPNDHHFHSLPTHFRKEALSHLYPLLILFPAPLILLGLVAYGWITNRLALNWGDALITLVLVLACGITLLIAARMLLDFVHRVTFDEDTISFHYPWRVRTYAVESLRDIRLKTAERTVRGIPRTFTTLELVFEGEARPEVISPSFSNSLGTRQEQARLQLAGLRAALLQHYPLVKQVGEEQARSPEKDRGHGRLRRRLIFLPYDLEVHEEDYGDHHMGAWSIHFTLSRPLVEGITRFRTTNGDLQHTRDGRFLVLHDFTQLVLFDLAREQAYHHRLGRGWQFQRVTLDREKLHVNSLCLTQPPRPASLDPIPLTQEALERILKPGTGTRPPGDFPSAYPAKGKAEPGSGTIEGGPTSLEPPSSAQAVEDLIGYARSMGPRLPEAFEDLRDSLHNLGPEAAPYILEAARANEDSDLLELLVIVLVDRAYPPALPNFLEWLDHPNEEIRFYCASAFDTLAEGHFGIAEMSPGGFVQHARIRETIPRIKDWWHREGRRRAPTLSKWRQKMAANPPISEQEKWFNFVELNPYWVRFGDGTAAPQEQGFRLPRGAGKHIVGGKVWMPQTPEPVFGAFVMESDLGRVQGVYIREGRAWMEVSDQMVRAAPNFSF